MAGIFLLMKPAVRSKGDFLSNATTHPSLQNDTSNSLKYQMPRLDTAWVLKCMLVKGKPGVQILPTFLTLAAQTTKVIMGLMEKCHLLDKGHHVYMDNYYSSPELFEELHYRNTYACGTCHSNRKNMSKAVINAKLKKGEAVFRCAGPLLFQVE